MIGKHLACVVVSLTLCLAGAPGSAIAAPADDGDGFLLNTGGWWGPIYRMEPSGKIEPLELSMVPNREAGFHQPGQPVFSPDQRWIAFTRDNDLWLSAVERDLEFPVTHAGQPSTDHLMAVYATARSWSPDSRYLIYRIKGNRMEGYCGCGGGPVPKPREAEYGFYRYDLERGKTLRLDEAENLSHFLMLEHAAWLDAKTFLVRSSASADTTEFPVKPQEVGRFVNSYPNPTRYFRVSSDGKKFSFVAGFGGVASQEDVSPDGKRMVVDVYTPGSSGERPVSRLWIVDLEHGDVAPLTDESSWHHAHQRPRFSPDGNSVAYECIRTTCANEDCSRKEQMHYLKVEGEIVAHCTLGGTRFEWIDERSIAARCDVKLAVVDVRTAEVLNKIEVPQPED